MESSFASFAFSSIVVLRQRSGMDVFLVLESEAGVDSGVKMNRRLENMFII